MVAHAAPRYVGTNAERIAEATGPLIAGAMWIETDTGFLLFWDGTRWANKNTSALFTQIASKTIANTITETTLISTGVGSVTLPAGYLTQGRSIRIFMRGYNSTKAAPAGTLTFKVKLGTTTAMATAAGTATASLSNKAFDLQAVITCRSTGATGTVFGQGTVLRATTTTASARWEMVKTAVVTIDTTISQAIDITAKWGTASASNTITATNLIVQSLN